MTNGPRLRGGKRLVPGLLAVGLFALMALITLNASFGEAAGFEADSITAAIGYALFDLEALQQEAGVTGTEPFLAAFLLVAVALDAALDASLVLAKREEEGQPVSPLGATGPDEAEAGSPGGPGPDSSGFGRSEPTATDGGRAGADSDADTDSTSNSTGGDRQ